MSMTPRQMPVTLFMFFFMELANSLFFCLMFCGASARKMCFSRFC